MKISLELLHEMLLRLKYTYNVQNLDDLFEICFNNHNDTIIVDEITNNIRTIDVLDERGNIIHGRKEI